MMSQGIPLATELLDRQQSQSCERVREYIHNDDNICGVIVI